MRLRPIPAALLAVALAGCTTAQADTRKHPTPRPHHSPSASATPTVSPTVSPVPRPTGLIVANGHGWTPAGLDGPMPAPGSCHIRQAADGEPLPDPNCTPGAIDAAVTDTNIGTTVCRPGGYTSSVRPPVSLTDPAKLKLMDAYGIPRSQASQYELDHLVALNDGGASDLRNLWPEPAADLHRYPRSTYVHNDKDQVESATFTAICARKVTVTAVQALMASDWTQAMARFGLTPGPAGYAD